MTTGNKTLSIFRGESVAVMVAVNRFLSRDPAWRIFVPNLATGNFVYPSYNDATQQEDNVRMLQDAQVKTALNACLHVVVSLPSHITEEKAASEILRWQDIAIDCGASVELHTIGIQDTISVQTLTHAPLGDPYTPNPDLPKAIWLDVDGTSFTMFDTDGTPFRSPFEYHKVHLDAPLQHTINVVKAMQDSGYKVVVVSGREASCEEATLKSFANVGIIPDDIYMRPVGSNIPDDKLKYDLFREKIEPKYNIELAFDDRDKVVRMLRTVLKIPVFQVNYGAF